MLWKRPARDRRAEIGIGSMVIFVSMVLTASGAASVVISSTSDVQQEAQSTSAQAINDVAAGIWVISVAGQVDHSLYEISKLDMYVRLQPGSPSLGLENMMVVVSYGDVRMELAFGDGAPTSTSYGCQLMVAASQASANWTQAHVLGYGDMAKLTIAGGAAGLGIKPLTHVAIDLIPNYGQATETGFFTPEVYESGWVALQ